MQTTEYVRRNSGVPGITEIRQDTKKSGGKFPGFSLGNGIINLFTKLDQLVTERELKDLVLCIVRLLRRRVIIDL